MIKTTAALLALLVLVAQVPEVRAGMEGVADTCPGTGAICFWHRPKLSPPPGWQPAEAASTRYQASAFVPAGSDFKHAAAVMYAKAMPVTGQTPDLPAFMSGDLAEFRQQYGDLHIQKGLTVTNGDGKTLAVSRLSPGSGSHAQWETVAYDQEGGYYLIFALSARSQAAHDAALPAFELMLKQYRASGPGTGK